MATKHVLCLLADERSELEAVTRNGRRSAEKIRRAQVLLKADEGEHGPGWTDEQISTALDVSRRMVQNVRKRAVEEGPTAALERKRRLTPPTPAKLDGDGEARLVALACSQPPEGRSHWTMQLLADELVVLGVVDAVSDETVRRTLKKTT